VVTQSGERSIYETREKAIKKRIVNFPIGFRMMRPPKGWRKFIMERATDLAVGDGGR
jgi:hypothetical protein